MTLEILDRIEIMVATQPAVLRNKLRLNAATVDWTRLVIEAIRAGEDDENDALCNHLSKLANIAWATMQSASAIYVEDCKRAGTEINYDDAQAPAGIRSRIAEIDANVKSIEDLSKAWRAARESGAVAQNRQLYESLIACCTRNAELIDRFRSDYRDFVGDDSTAGIATKKD